MLLLFETSNRFPSTSTHLSISFHPQGSFVQTFHVVRCFHDAYRGLLKQNPKMMAAPILEGHFIGMANVLKRCCKATQRLFLKRNTVPAKLLPELCLKDATHLSPGALDLWSSGKNHSETPNTSNCETERYKSFPKSALWQCTLSQVVKELVGLTYN